MWTLKISCSNVTCPLLVKGLKNSVVITLAPSSGGHPVCIINQGRRKGGVEGAMPPPIFFDLRNKVNFAPPASIFLDWE